MNNHERALKLLAFEPDRPRARPLPAIHAVPRRLEPPTRSQLALSNLNHPRWAGLSRVRWSRRSGVKREYTFG
jgi:hypothetical protein